MVRTLWGVFSSWIEKLQVCTKARESAACWRGEGNAWLFWPKPGDGVVKGLRVSCSKAAGEGKKPATFSPFTNLLLSFANADLITGLPSEIPFYLRQHKSRMTEGLSARASTGMACLHPVRTAHMSFGVPGRLTSMTEFTTEFYWSYQQRTSLSVTSSQGALWHTSKDEHWGLRVNLFHGHIPEDFQDRKKLFTESSFLAGLIPGCTS